MDRSGCNDFFFHWVSWLSFTDRLRSSYIWREPVVVAQASDQDPPGVTLWRRTCGRTTTCWRVYISHLQMPLDPSGEAKRCYWGDGRLDYPVLICCHHDWNPDKQKKMCGLTILTTRVQTFVLGGPNLKPNEFPKLTDFFCFRIGVRCKKINSIYVCETFFIGRIVMWCEKWDLAVSITGLYKPEDEWLM